MTHPVLLTLRSRDMILIQIVVLVVLASLPGAVSFYGYGYQPMYLMAATTMQPIVYPPADFVDQMTGNTIGPMPFAGAGWWG
ncbi:hypothetical protein Y032_0106g3769 [Ancylostoma ceylanicum]|uniref:Uncharacterized protein n=1 Tax=Ancylostoma ceylanicum TaxID=53326 RepID=A0A016TF84_9BILA|nr:hypothetical protein Y032_0106g3769 [Ancylostoma ceylanicum]